MMSRFPPFKLNSIDMTFYIKIILYLCVHVFQSSPEAMFIDERETQRETSIGFLPYVPSPKVEFPAEACALNQDKTGKLLGVWDDAPTNWATLPGPHGNNLENVFL